MRSDSDILAKIRRRLERHSATQRRELWVKEALLEGPVERPREHFSVRSMIHPAFSADASLSVTSFSRPLEELLGGAPDGNESLLDYLRRVPIYLWDDAEQGALTRPHFVDETLVPALLNEEVDTPAIDRALIRVDTSLGSTFLRFSCVAQSVYPGLQAIAIDVTESLRFPREAESMLGILATAAHNLRQPLSTMLAQELRLRQILRDHPVDDRLRADLLKVQLLLGNAAKEYSVGLERLPLLTDIREGQIPVASFVRRLVSQYSSTAVKRDLVGVELEFEGNCESATIEASAANLASVLQNTIDNARKAHRDAKSLSKVSVRCALVASPVGSPHSTRFQILITNSRGAMNEDARADWNRLASERADSPSEAPSLGSSGLKVAIACARRLPGGRIQFLPTADALGTVVDVLCDVRLDVSLVGE